MLGLGGWFELFAVKYAERGGRFHTGKKNREQNLINTVEKENFVFTILKIKKRKRIVLKISQIEKRKRNFVSKS